MEWGFFGPGRKGRLSLTITTLTIVSRTMNGDSLR